MARVIDIDSIQVPLGLETVANAQPATQGPAAADWNTANFGSIKIWSGVSLDDAQVLTLGNDLIANIVNNNISAQTAVKCLRLAMSLRTMNAGANNHLIVPQERVNDAAHPNAMINIPNIEAFSSTAFSLRPTQVVATGNAQAVVVVANVPATRVLREGADSEVQKRSSYSFIAAFLMRLVVKSAENVAQGVPNMKVRYETFYGPASTASSFAITLQQAATLKEALLSQTLIGQTFTHAIANTHQNHMAELTSHESGVLSYLGYLPLSYTGMHAYNLIMEIKYSTHIGLDKVLALFYCDITAPAITKIADIVNNYERTEEFPDRDVTFRYCTLWGPQYFSSLRSKNSVHLVYTAACAWSTIKSGGSSADPESIAAINSLSQTMKRTLKRAGQIIGEALKSKMLKGANASEAFGMALEDAAEASNEAVNVDDRQFEDL
nr:TPA_asm: N [Heliosperma gammacytorhabdovirus 1]